jgi:hypothetical protein
MSTNDLNNSLIQWMESVKDAPALRLDLYSRLESNKKFFRDSLDMYPSLLSELPNSSYLDVPIGWRSIVVSLFWTLLRYPVVLKQVKQKFGDLKVYYKISDNTVPDLPLDVLEKSINQEIEVAVELAAITCEFCSSMQNVTLFEVGYVCRICADCSRLLCEYNLVNWMVNGSSNELNPRQIYCLDKLRGKNPEGVITRLSRSYRGLLNG